MKKIKDFLQKMIFKIRLTKAQMLMNKMAVINSNNNSNKIIKIIIILIIIKMKLINNNSK